MSGYYSLETLYEDVNVKPKVDLLEKSRQPPTEEALEKTIQSLKNKQFIVDVVENGKEFLELLKKTIPSGSSIHNSGSTTLFQIGYFEMNKEEPGWNDLNAKVHQESDPEKSSELRRQASIADYFITSPSALSEEGDIVLADLSGTKVGPVHTAKKTIFIVPYQKIVSSYEDALKRTEVVALELESARARLAYGVPSSLLANILSLKFANVMAPGKFHVVIVKEVLGF